MLILVLIVDFDLSEIIGYLAIGSSGKQNISEWIIGRKPVFGHFTVCVCASNASTQNFARGKLLEIHVLCQHYVQCFGVPIVLYWDKRPKPYIAMHTCRK